MASATIPNSSNDVIPDDQIPDQIEKDSQQSMQVTSSPSNLKKKRNESDDETPSTSVKKSKANEDPSIKVSVGNDNLTRDEHFLLTLLAGNQNDPERKMLVDIIHKFRSMFAENVKLSLTNGTLVYKNLMLIKDIRLVKTKKNDSEIALRKKNTELQMQFDTMQVISLYIFIYTFIFKIFSIDALVRVRDLMKFNW